MRGGGGQAVSEGDFGWRSTRRVGASGPASPTVGVGVRRSRGVGRGNRPGGRMPSRTVRGKKAGNQSACAAHGFGPPASRRRMYNL